MGTGFAVTRGGLHLDSAAVHGPLEIHKPWARSSSHPPARATSPAPSCRSRTRARPTTGWSPPAARLAECIELHGIKVVGADIDMRPLANGVPIQAGHTTTLKPRGYHLLLQGVKTPLAKGSTLPITPTFEKAGAVAVEFAVEEPGLIGEAILTRSITADSDAVRRRRPRPAAPQGAHRDRRRGSPARSAPCRGRPARRARRSAAPSPLSRPRSAFIRASPRSTETRKCAGAAHQIGMVQVVELYPRASPGRASAPRGSRPRR